MPDHIQDEKDKLHAELEHEKQARAEQQKPSLEERFERLIHHLKKHGIHAEATEDATGQDGAAVKVAEPEPEKAPEQEDGPEVDDEPALAAETGR